MLLLPTALMPVLGWAGPAASGLLTLVLAVRLGSGGHGANWWARSAIGAALLGGVVGIASVIAAFADAGGDRSGFGWLALVCAVAAAAAALFSVTRPYLASIILVTSGIVGESPATCSRSTPHMEPPYFSGGSEPSARRGAQPGPRSIPPRGRRRTEGQNAPVCRLIPASCTPFTLNKPLVLAAWIGRSL
ncbi:MAG: hypothetical protein ACRDG4_18710 [Chloroflexota bacterium]